MKKFLFLFFAVIGMTSLLSCEDKDDGGVVKNNASSLQIYGQDYALTSGVIWKGSKFVTTPTEEYIFNDTYEDEEENTVTDRVVGVKASNGASVEAGNFMVSLYDNGLFYSPEIAMARGKGALISLHMASPDFEKLAPGKYHFSKTKEPNSFSGYLSSYYDMEKGTDVPATIGSGEVNVSMEGDQYRINFDCVTTFGGVAKGEYIGTLTNTTVERDALGYNTDIQIAGLRKRVSYLFYFYGEVIEEGEEYDIYNEGLLATAYGRTSSADAGSNAAKDIALFYDEDNNTVFFETPIKVRTKFGEMRSDFTFPCHTLYKLAPSSFTDSDFDNLKYFDFEIDEEEKVEFSVENFRPGYVFFKAGNGTKGVMKVKSIKPLHESKIDLVAGAAWISFMSSPTLNIDLKYSASFSNPKIR